MNTLNSKVVNTYSSPFAQTYNSINDIPFRHNLDGVMITSPQVNTDMVPPLPHPSRKVVKRNTFKNSSPVSVSSTLSVSASSS